tara:strand:- start:460 stop:738 length:279 start_codon:yes stop_codon:yes gene_type:complete
MAIDLEKMRAKLDAAKGKGNKTGFWKPPEGKTTIRIVPTPDGDPFKQYWFHYNLAQHGFLSPKRNFNEDDASRRVRSRTMEVRHRRGQETRS